MEIIKKKIPLLAWLLILPIAASSLTFGLTAKAEPTPPGPVEAPSGSETATQPPASDSTSGSTSGAKPSSGSSGSPSDAKGGTTTGTSELANPFGTKDLRVIIGRFGSIMTNIVGSLALLMFVYGGFVLLTSRGNTDKIKQGREIFVWTTVGLFIIFGAQAIITAIINILSSGHI